MSIKLGRAWLTIVETMKLIMSSLLSFIQLLHLNTEYLHELYIGDYKHITSSEYLITKTPLAFLQYTPLAFLHYTPLVLFYIIHL